MLAMSSQRQPDNRINIATSADVREGVELLLLRSRRALDVETAGRILSRKLLINAALLYFLELPKDVQFAALKEFIPRFLEQVGEEFEVASDSGDEAIEIVNLSEPRAATGTDALREAKYPKKKRPKKT